MAELIEQSSTETSTPAPQSDSWFLKFTSHLGYSPPFRLQFAESVGTTDPVAHVNFAASIGMAGVLDPWAAARPRLELQAIADVMRANGLIGGCVVGVPLESTFRGPWTDRSPSGRAQLESHITGAARAAVALRSTCIAVLITSDPDREDREQQIDDAAANIREMSGIAEDSGLAIAIEPMVAIPGMLLTSTASAVELLRRADHRNAGLIFDTGHVSDMGEDVLQTFEAVAENVTLLQLADNPGRVEPGAGRLPLVQLAARAVERGYDGLIDLEHEWSSTDEAAGLARWRAFDAAVRDAVQELARTTTYRARATKPV